MRTTTPPSQPSQEGTCPRARGAWLSQATWTGCEMETGLPGPVLAGAQGTTNVTGSQTRNQGQRLRSPGPLQHTGGRQRAAPECFIPAVLRSPHGPHGGPTWLGKLDACVYQVPLGSTWHVQCRQRSHSPGAGTGEGQAGATEGLDCKR